MLDQLPRQGRTEHGEGHRNSRRVTPDRADVNHTISKFNECTSNRHD